MKIKSDFVTNSSSSSFIVVFPKKIKTLKDVEKFIQPINKAEVVLKDSLKQKPIKIDFDDGHKNISLLEVIEKILAKTIGNPKQIIKEIKAVLIDEVPEVIVKISHIDHLIMKIQKKEKYYDWDDYFVCEDQDEIKLKKIIENNNKGFIYRYTYSDNDGEFFSEMEHGGTFDRLPHVIISHH